MTDPLYADTRVQVKNKLEKQDEIEVQSDEEEETLTEQTVAAPTKPQARRKSKKGTSPHPEQRLLTPRIVADRLPKQTSAPSGGEKVGMPSEGDGHARKSSVPVAHVHVTETGDFRKPRSELATPRHLGSLAFSSMSTEESSSICDADTLNRHLGTLSLQGSLQDESYGSGERNQEEFATTAEFLLHTWHTNHKDRQFLLQNEKLLEELVGVKEEQAHLVGGLNSYYRMLLHRLADVWGVEHNLCTVNGLAKISLKVTEESKKPDQLFRDMADKVPDEPGKALLKRPKNNSLPESHAPLPLHPMRPAKSLEERQAHYEQVRERIFGSDHGTENVPKPYGLDQSHPEEAGGGGGNHVAYRRSHSAISETGSEAAFDEQQQRLAYGQFAGRPIMVQPMGLYQNPYVYQNPLVGYGSAEMGSMDPNVYMGQGPYYPLYGPQGYGGAQSMMYPGMAYAPQQGFPPPQYFPAQNTMDPSQAPSVYDQPTGQYLYSPYAPPLDMAHPQHHPSGGGYLPAVDQASSPYHYDPHPRPHPDPRFGPPLIRQPLEHPEAAGRGAEWIIPLQLPGMGQPGGNALNGMFLKIPAPRAVAGGAEMMRQSSSSGRSSAENVGYYKQEYRSPSPKDGQEGEN